MIFLSKIELRSLAPVDTIVRVLKPKESVSFRCYLIGNLANMKI